MDVWNYVWLGIFEVFAGNPAFEVFGIPVSITIVMVIAGFLAGIVVGSTPGLAGPWPWRSACRS